MRKDLFNKEWLEEDEMYEMFEILEEYGVIEEIEEDEDKKLEREWSKTFRFSDINPFIED